jgi:hypothetical protein
VGLGAELHQHPYAARGAWGASSIRLAKKNARRPGLRGLPPKTWPGWLSYAPCAREGQGDQSNGLATIYKQAKRVNLIRNDSPTIYKPCQMCKKKIIAVHVIRW